MQRFELNLVEQIPRLRRYARALLGRSHYVDDLVQECLEKAWAKSHQWRVGSNMRAWVFSIMHNLYVDQVRKNRRQGNPLPLVERDQPTTDGGHESRQAIAELDEGLDRLSTEQREVLLLVALEGLTYEEVAATLDIPLGTVMSRLYRAREAMRRWMDGDSQPQLRSVK